MKKAMIPVFAVIILGILNSCNTVEISDPFPSNLVKGCYVINFGSFGDGGASISKFNYETTEMTNFYYKKQNAGAELLSNIQHACYYNDSVYLIGNVTDQLITVNPLFVQSRNGLTGELQNPRFCVPEGKYLFISCWGANPDYTQMPDSYVAVYNLETNRIDKKIELPGGPEGMAIANGKLYVALNYKMEIAVVNITDFTIKTIKTPAVTSYFQKDAGENLYVTLVSTWTHFSAETGLGFLDTKTDQLTEIYAIENVSSAYGTMIHANADLTKIYVVTSAYDENWNLSGAVQEFDVTGKVFNTNPFIQNIPGISGIAANKVNNNLYVFSAESTTGFGKMNVYSSTGTFIETYNVGAFPIGAIFLE